MCGRLLCFVLTSVVCVCTCVCVHMCVYAHVCVCAHVCVSSIYMYIPFLLFHNSK